MDEGSDRALAGLVMPPVSQRQRKAMFAAASGHSTLGIPRSVGREFANADPGGKLPLRKSPTGGLLGANRRLAKRGK